MKEVYSGALDMGGKVEDISRPTYNLNWFWGPIHDFGLFPLHFKGFMNVSHVMLTALSKR